MSISASISDASIGRPASPSDDDDEGIAGDSSTSIWAYACLSASSFVCPAWSWSRKTTLRACAGTAQGCQPKDGRARTFSLKESTHFILQERI